MLLQRKLISDWRLQKQKSVPRPLCGSMWLGKDLLNVYITFMHVWVCVLNCTVQPGLVEFIIDTTVNSASLFDIFLYFFSSVFIQNFFSAVSVFIILWTPILVSAVITDLLASHVAFANFTSAAATDVYHQCFDTVGRAAGMASGV